MFKNILFSIFLINTFYFTFSNDVFAREKYFGSPKKITDWTMQCSTKANKEAVLDKYPTYIFRPVKNTCGTSSTLRSQIKSRKAISTTITSSYNFQSIFSISDKSFYKERFDFFSIEDGRQRCAPPFVLSIESNGNLNIRGDYKIGRGEQCNRDVLNKKSFQFFRN